MPFKNIVVLANRSPAFSARTRYAVKLALRYGAHLTGIFITPSTWSANSAESHVRGQAAIQQLIEQHDARETAAAEAARRDFNAAMSGEPISFEFRVIAESGTSALLKLQSLHADLADRGASATGWFASACSGRTASFDRRALHCRTGALGERDSRRKCPLRLERQQGSPPRD